VGTECPEFPSKLAAVLCDFKIMLAGSFLGLGATAGGLLGSGTSGGELSWKLEVQTGGGLAGDSSLTEGLAEVFFAGTPGCSGSKSTVAPGIVEIPAGGGTFTFSGREGVSGSSIKSDGGGIIPRSTSVDNPGRVPVLVTLLG